MATRSLNVVITGDSKPLGVASKQADKHMGGVEKSAGRMGKAVKAGFAVAAVGTGALVVGLKKSVDAAVEAEKSQAKLKAQLNASGASYRAHAKEIDAVIQKHSRLAGVDDEDLQDAFTGLVRSTGKVSVAMKDMGLVTDIMRGKNVDAAAAGKILEKVHNGNVTGLKKLGIAIDPVTAAQDKLKESTKHATAEQVSAAKAADKTATAQKGIAELQKRFGGQAEAYGKTAAGAQDRFAVAMENVQEKLGAKLLPVLGKVANGVAHFLDQIDRGTGAGGRFADGVTAAFARVSGAVSTVSSSIRSLVTGFQQGEGGARALVSVLGAVVSGFVAFRIVATVTAGVTALKAAWAGLSAAMATNPIGLVAVAIGAVIGALAVMSVNTRSASAASRDLNDALRAQADALRAVRDIDVDVAQRKANLASANVSVEQAEKRLHELRRSGKASATDIKQAEADLEQARVAQARATRDVGDAEEDSKRKRQDATKATREAEKKTRDLVDIKKDDLHKTESLIKTQEAYASTLTDGSVKAHEMAGEIGSLRTRAQQLRQEIAKLENKTVEVKVDLVLAPGGGKPFTNPFDKTGGDGIGSALSNSVSQIASRGAGSLLPSGGGGGGSLMGAKSIMSPFVSMAGRFGLHTSSGLRPGAITSSGNPSFHGTGNAVDEAGSPAGMLGYFRYLKAKFGPRLRELIYTPGGQGIKDGKPFTYTGQVAADHFDHVHVAYTGGAGDGAGRRPGTGDGLGQFDSTAYGPPWDAMNGTGVTATGVNLKSGQHAYGVAVDPSVIPLGSKLKITPNPFSYSGPFTAFDTGGAIKGKHIDFYDWRGRKAQLGWGHRSVSISMFGGSSTGGGKGGSSKKGPKQIKGGSASGGGIGKYDPSATYSSENEAYSDPFSPSDTAATRAFVNARGGAMTGRPLKGGGPSKGFTQDEQDVRAAARQAAADAAAAQPTLEDFATARVARARLSGTDSQEYKDALGNLLQLRQSQMDAALSDSSPLNDEAAIDAYLSVKDSIDQLAAATEANTAALDEQRKSFERLIAEDYRTKYNVSQSQYGVLAQAVAEASNVGIGTRLGLSLSGLRAAPGAVART